MKDVASLTSSEVTSVVHFLRPTNVHSERRLIGLSRVSAMIAWLVGIALTHVVQDAPFVNLAEELARA